MQQSINGSHCLCMCLGKRWSCIYWVFKAIVKVSYPFIENMKEKEITSFTFAALTIKTEQKYSKNGNSDRF